MDDKVQINEKDEIIEIEKQKEDKKEISKEEEEKNKNENKKVENTVISNNSIEKDDSKEIVTDINLNVSDNKSDNEKKENQMIEIQDQPRVIIIPIGKIIFGIIAILLIMVLFSNISKILPEKKEKNINEEISLEYNENGAFLLEINENGKGEYARGKIVRGTVKVGDEIELIGLDEKSIFSTVSEIYVDRSNEKHKNVESAKIGENVEIHFKVDKENIKIGKVLAQKGTITASNRVEVNISPSEYLEKSEEEKEIENGKTYTFYVRQTNIKGSIELDRDKIKISKDNKNFKIIINLEKSVAIDKNTKFYLVEGGRKLIECIVTK